VSYDKRILSVLNPDQIISRRYHKNGDNPIFLFISYYNTLEKADLSHSPAVCSTGQGWEIESTGVKEITLNLPDMPNIKVNRIIEKKDGTAMIILYWYHSGNRVFTNRGVQKYSLFFDRLLGRPEGNAFITTSAIVGSGASVEETTLYMFSFIRALYPELGRFFFES